MLEIALCDDDELFRTTFHCYIDKYTLIRKIEYSLALYQDGESLVKDIEAGRQFDIIFLDVDLEQMNGLDTASRIRSYSKEIVLVFISAYIQYCPASLEVRAFRYILKDYDDIQKYIDEFFNAYMQMMEEDRQYIWLTDRKESVRFRVKDIAYFESEKHRLNIYNKDNQNVFQLYMTLNDCQELVSPHDFVRIHQSYLVNLDCVAKMYNYKIYLKNDTVLNSSRKYFMQAKDIYLLYLGRK